MKATVANVVECSTPFLTVIALVRTVIHHVTHVSIPFWSATAVAVVRKIGVLLVVRNELMGLGGFE